MKRRVPFIALALCILAQAALAMEMSDRLRSSHDPPATAPPRPVVSVIVEDRGAEARWIPGTIESRTQVDMAFQTLGRMVQRHVDLGDRVAKGELLAELATEDLVANTRAARAAMQSAEVQSDTAQATLDRTKELFARNVASAVQLEQAQRAATSARASVEQARSQLVQAEDAEGFARMTAPFDGVVSAIYEAPGAIVGAGGAVLQLAADDEREAVIDLPESALPSLPPGAAFTVWHRTDPDHQVSAILDRIDPLADTATRTRRAHLTLPEDTNFLLGSLIRARLGTATDPALAIPEQAIFDRDGNPHVWRVRREGEGATVEAVAVKTGASLRGQVVVTSGLQELDEVVIRGVHSLRDGQAVGRRVEP